MFYKYCWVWLWVNSSGITDRQNNAHMVYESLLPGTYSWIIPERASVQVSMK